MAAPSGVYARRAVAVMDRSTLEDRYHDLLEENQLLKKHAKSQEEKMKRMATKLLRLKADERKRGQAVRSGPGSSVDWEEKVEEMQARVWELEKQNANLKGKITVLRQQVDSRGRRHTPYDRVPPRVNSGVTRKPLTSKAYSTEDVSVTPRKVVAAPIPPGPVRFGHSLLEEARKDALELEELVLTLKEEISLLRAELVKATEEKKERELHHEQEVLRLQDQIQAQVMTAQKSSIKEDVEIIKLQRELREKSDKLLTSQSQCLSLERNLESTRANQTKLLNELELLTAQLKHQQQRNAELQSQTQAGGVAQSRIIELQGMVSDLRAEKELLKQSNDKLLKSLLEPSAPAPRRVWGEEGNEKRVLQERIIHLEEMVRSTASEKSAALEQLVKEKAMTESVRREASQVRKDLEVLQASHRDLQHKASQKKQERPQETAQQIDSTVEEAIAYLKLKKERGENPLSFLEPVDGHRGSDYELQELQVAHAQTISELEKTRKLLALQSTITKDCKREVEAVKDEMNNLRREYNKRLEESAQLIDIKTSRIKKLESQLRSIAYSTKSYKINTSELEYTGDMEDNSIHLEKGQNLLQVHAGQLSVTPEALSGLSASPALFLSLSLPGYEAQVSPVHHTTSPLFEFTSNYLVTVNDHFLDLLSKEPVLVELYQASGMRYQCLGSGSLSLQALLTSTGNKVNGQLVLFGLDQSQSSALATLEYWMKLQIPIAQSARLHQERNLAVAAIGPIPALPPPPRVMGVDENEAVITVAKCSGLSAKEGQLPSSYAMYQFYTFPDHDTVIVANSQNPDYHDTKCFVVTMNPHLHSYLTTSSMEVYVFDDKEPVEAGYLGQAHIPLRHLAEGKPVEGVFGLKTASGSEAGSVEVSVSWRHPYRRMQLLSPQSSTDSIADPKQEEGEYSAPEPAITVATAPVSIATTTQSAHHMPTVVAPSNASPPSEHTASLTFTSLSESGSEESGLTEDSPGEPPPLVKVVTQPASHQHEQQEFAKDVNHEPASVPSESHRPSSQQQLNHLQPQQGKWERHELAPAQEDGSLTLTGISDEEEEVEEELTEVSEDTVFEETLPTTDLSVSVSPNPTLVTPPPRPSVIMSSQSEAEMAGEMVSEGELSLEDESDEDPIVQPKQALVVSAVEAASAETPVVFSLTIVSLTLEDGSSLLSDQSVTRLFVEYHFLDYEASELETPASLPKPSVSKPAIFNFRKEFCISRSEGETFPLLLAMMQSNSEDDRSITFTLVSDPEESDDDECVELGVAELDILEALQDGQDSIELDVDVVDINDTEEVLGFLTIAMDGLLSLSILRKQS